MSIFKKSKSLIAFSGLKIGQRFIVTRSFVERTRFDMAIYYVFRKTLETHAKIVDVRKDVVIDPRDKNFDLYEVLGEFRFFHPTDEIVPLRGK